MGQSWRLNGRVVNEWREGLRSWTARHSQRSPCGPSQLSVVVARAFDRSPDTGGGRCTIEIAASAGEERRRQGQCWRNQRSPGKYGVVPALLPSATAEAASATCSELAFSRTPPRLKPVAVAPNF
jgi:hypothetical protein